MWQIYQIAKDIGFPVQTILTIGIIAFFFIKYLEKRFGKNNPGNSGKHVIKSDECSKHRDGIYDVIKENQDIQTKHFMDIKEDIGVIKGFIKGKFNND